MTTATPGQAGGLPRRKRENPEFESCRKPDDVEREDASRKQSDRRVFSGSVHIIAQSKGGGTPQSLGRRLGLDPDEVPFVEACVEHARTRIRFHDNDGGSMLTLNMNGAIRGVFYVGCLQARIEQRPRELEDWFRFSNMQ